MSLPVQISIANPDPSAAPTTLTELIVLLRTLITAVVTGTYVPYVTGSATPSVDDQNKLWHRTDGAGRPLGTFKYYSGTWRRQYSGRLHQIAMYNGDPSVDFAGSGGLGTVGGEWDGWALCNGNNGTANLTDKFVVGSHMSDLGTGYTGGSHKTNVSGASMQTGGVATITLTDDNTYRPARAAISVRKWEADGNTPNAGGTLYGSGTADLTLLSADAGKLTPDAIATLPPYYALAFVQFVGYA